MSATSANPAFALVKVGAAFPPRANGGITHERTVPSPPAGQNINRAAYPEPLRRVPRAIREQFAPGSLACAGVFAAACVAGRRRHHRGRHSRGSTHVVLRVAETAAATQVNNKAAALRRESSESVLQLAQKANIKLEVKPWDFLSDIAKNSARAWFVKRAEERGIPWDASVEDLQAQQANLDHLYTAIIDPSIDYPAYYTQPFHGYDEGNLNWKAAHELWAATSSMCLSYYDGMSWQDSQEKYRGAARDHIVDYWQTATSSDGTAASPQSLLDLGCSGGLSTYEMTRAFPGVEATGVDLSPHFLSVAKHTYPDLNFVHAKGEEMSFADSTFDVVTINFLLHELPLATTREVLCEARRVLRPGGILSVLDLDARRLLELPPLRRWAFQVTEPWCKDGEYFSFAAKTELEKLGFRNVQYTQNDPVNAIVLATK